MNGKNVLFVDVYQALYRQKGSTALPMSGKEVDWKTVSDRGLESELDFWPVPDAMEILDRAESEEGFEIVFISDRPNIQQMAAIQLLRQDALLRKIQKAGPGQKPAYNPYSLDRRRLEFQPVMTEPMPSAVWKASIVGATEADQVIYIGGAATCELLANQVPAVRCFSDMVSFEKSLSPLEGFFKPRAY